MVNYIELNGEKSTSVKGLIIQSLPPITKPKMRTSKEEIDGRDGDVVTKLGYSAYDKQLSIGLHGDFDIDDAIAFFDSEGEVVFGNEPDKYYRYQILDEIDFERLVRFRTAKVKMHVQPFKHDAVDRVFDIVNQFLHIEDSTAGKFGITVTSSNGSIRVAGKATSDVDIEVPIESMSLSGSYTLAASASGSAAGCALMLIDGSPSRSFGDSYMELKSDGDSTMTATADSSAEYDALWLDIKAGTSVDFTLSVTMASNSFNQIALTNRGNVASRPTVTVYGSGNVELAINAVTVLSFSIDDGYITIDADEMNAYHGDTLMNRRVTGDYSDLRLNVGENVISWRGDVTAIRIEDFSRWL
ncbi:distal tail protein Dit [uncultured Senegalimassilia sp.]|uniref:distal tail protein Dit n=1 Tax=uncultured Senegalimassilia sp. TaxID=1714350 RepID=UPI0026226758|nr:distal tail protein Dit [uncultured Senegalimassilia sp.]